MSLARVIPRSGSRVMSTSRSGLDDAVLEHQVELRRAAGEVRRVRVGADQRDGLGRVVGARVYSNGRIATRSLACATSRIAATMFGYAPQRQRLPLMNSRISSSEPARPSAQQRDRRHDLPRRAVAALEARHGG